MHRYGYAKTIGLVIVVVAVVGFVWYAAISPTIGWPVEARRVVHPAGFSVVQPLGWEMHKTVSNGPKTFDTIRFLPEKSVGSPGYFAIAKFNNDQTDEGLYQRKYAATTFDGRPAFERWSTFDLTREHSRSLVFQRDGSWYELTLRRPSTEAITDGIWLKYLLSFRTEERSEAPASQPAGDLIDTIDRPATQPTTAPTP